MMSGEHYGQVTCRDVRFWHFSDIPPTLISVRYLGKADMMRTDRYVC